MIYSLHSVPLALVQAMIARLGSRSASKETNPNRKRIFSKNTTNTELLTLQTREVATATRSRSQIPYILPHSNQERSIARKVESNHWAFTPPEVWSLNPPPGKIMHAKKEKWIHPHATTLFHKSPWIGAIALVDRNTIEKMSKLIRWNENKSTSTCSFVVYE